MPPEGLDPQIRFILERPIGDIVLVIVEHLRALSLQAKHNSQMSKRNRMICDLYAGGMTQGQIAARFGITPERVSQIIHLKA